MTLQVSSTPSYLLGSYWCWWCRNGPRCRRRRCWRCRDQCHRYFFWGVRGYVFWCIRKRWWFWSRSLGDYALVWKLVETRQFNSWLIEVNSFIGRVAFLFLLFVSVVYDHSLHCWLLLIPVAPSFLVGVQEGVGGLFWAGLVAKIVEVGAFLFFFDLWLRVIVIFFLGSAHGIEIYIYLSILVGMY